MRDFLKVVRRLLVTPWLYVYSLVSIIGIVAAHLNSGLGGSPLLGATGIASSIICVCLFYWQLAKLRQGKLPGKQSGFGLFLSTFAFRIRLLLLFSPLIALFYFLNYFTRVSDGFLQVTIAQPEEKFSLYLHFLLGIWPLALAYLACSLIDTTGRSLVVAKGFSDHALKHSARVLMQLWLPIILFTAIGVLLYGFGEYFSSFDKWRPWENSITLRLLYDCVTAPIGYALDMSFLLFIAHRIRDRMPDLLGPIRQSG